MKQCLNHPIARRSAMKWTALAAMGLTLRPHRTGAAAVEQPVPVRALTRGPKFHWFGYYDKWQFDRTNRYVLGMETDFENRSPRADDVVKIGMADLQDNDRWIELGQTSAWCWQQGCMLQWRPGSRSEIIWNDRSRDSYVCHILDVTTRKKRTIPQPIYCVSPDGKWAVANDFRRVGDTRPGYGYNGIPDPWRNESAPKDSGIWHVDLETGKQKLIISLAQMAAVPPFAGDVSKAKHWFNHLLINPDGTRFEFLHRWKVPEGKGPISGTRMFTAAPDGSQIRFLNTDTSHFNWRDAKHLLAWARHASHGMAFYLFEDADNGQVELLPKEVIPNNGHCSYLPGLEWLLADSYPDAKDNQIVALYNFKRQQRYNIGTFPQPREYNHKYMANSEWRCDLHPRFSRDGRMVVIDAAHLGGRQMYLLDISGLAV